MSDPSAPEPDAPEHQNPFDPDYVPPGQTPPAAQPSDAAGANAGGEAGALPDLAKLMAQCADDAITHARESFGAELDRSRDSIVVLEMIGHTIHHLLEEGDELTDAEFDQICKLYGGYLGEVMRRILGGVWEYDLEAAPGQAVISLKLASGRVFPPMKWARRIEKGTSEDIRVFFDKVENAGKPPAPKGE